LQPVLLLVLFFVALHLRPIFAAISFALLILSTESVLISWSTSAWGSGNHFLWICSRSDFDPKNFIKEDVEKEDVDELSEQNRKILEELTRGRQPHPQLSNAEHHPQPEHPQGREQHRVPTQTQTNELASQLAQHRQDQAQLNQELRQLVQDAVMPSTTPASLSTAHLVRDLLPQLLVQQQQSLLPILEAQQQEQYRKVLEDVQKVLREQREATQTPSDRARAAPPPAVGTGVRGSVLNGRRTGGTGAGSPPAPTS